MSKSSTVAEYLAGLPLEARKGLKQIRAAIRKAAPGITERLSYRIPVFELEGKYLLYMAAFKSHVSIYPATKGVMQKYGARLRPHRSGAGTLRFELGSRLPLGLITKLAKLRVQERRYAAALRRRRSAARR